jgi:acetolactate synthase-1/3 small subunit
VSAPAQTWVVAVLLDDDLLALNRAAGILRRRNLPIGNIALGATGRAGILRLTCAVTSDRAGTDRLANALRKMVEVREVTVYDEAACVTREHALVRVRVSPAGLPALLDVVSLFEATVVEERPTDLLIEATGTGPFLTSFFRALEPFGILDLARGGALVLPRTPAAEAAGAHRSVPPVPAAVPA